MSLSSLAGFTFRATVLLASLLLFVAVSYPQGVGSSRGLPGGTGRHTIKGRVFGPSGRPYGHGLPVRLESEIVGASTTVTDGDGAFIFNNLPAGNYAVAIDAGPNFEPARESLTIYGTGVFNTYSSPQTVNIPIHLREKRKLSAKGKVLNAALAGIPKAAVNLFHKSRESAAKGDHKTAAEQLKAALAIYPNFPLALSDLGVQYLKLAQPAKAAETLATALRLAPDEISPRLNYGIALLNLKRFAEAEIELRQVISRNDALPTAHMYLGIVLMSRQRLGEAEQELLKAVATNDSEVALAHRYLAGIYWGQRQYKKAADELETYLKLVPNAADAEKSRAAIRELRSKEPRT
jgi:tetratricopeptide (TPR) repeat protein